MNGLVGAGLALLASGAPLALEGPITWYYGLLATLVLAVGGGLSAERDALRTVTGVLLVGWVLLAVALGEGQVDVVAITSGLALRGWAGVPELARLGRPGLPDLAAEMVGGAAVAGLVVVASRRADALPPGVLLVALALTGAIVAAAVVRLRR